MCANFVDKTTDHVKVVAHHIDGSLFKGYADGVLSFHAESLALPRTDAPPERLKLRLADSGELVEVDMGKLKALYFVRTFEGSTEYNEMKFFKAHPLVEGLWVSLEFSDKEKTEGVVYNSLHYVVNPGFFLKPPDPQSNNHLVYVLKNSLTDFCIMGVRGTY